MDSRKKPEEWQNEVHFFLTKMINERFGRNRKAKEALAERLGIKYNALNKRLSGASGFSAGELVFLATEFGLSLDQHILKDKSFARMSMPSLNQPVSSIEGYLSNLKTLLGKLEMIPKAEIHYATREVPAFYYFLDPVLAAFKLYIFAKVVWQLKGFDNDAKFSLDLFSTHNLNMCKDIWDKYAQIPSSEIWNPNVWDNTLQQVTYLLETNQFEKKEDALVLIDSIEKVIHKTMTIASEGKKTASKKSLSGRIDIYNNRILHTNNIILAGNDDYRMVFITHDNPNFLYSEDETLATYTRGWLDRLIQFSQPIMMDNLVEREQFFESMQHKINLTRAKINGMINLQKEFI